MLNWFLYLKGKKAPFTSSRRKMYNNFSVCELNIIPSEQYNYAIVPEIITTLIS